MIKVELPQILSGLRILFLLFGLFLLFLSLKKSIDIVLRRLIIFHLLTSLPVFRICLFLLCKDLSIFHIQFFNRRDFPFDFRKSLLSSLMKSDFFTVCLEELFAVSALTVSYINLLCLRIVDDVLFKICNLCKSCLQRLLTFCNIGKSVGNRLGLGYKFIIISKIMLFQKQKSLCHLLDVMNLSPSFIAGTFALGNHLLNIKKHIKPWLSFLGGGSYLLTRFTSKNTF